MPASSGERSGALPHEAQGARSSRRRCGTCAPLPPDQVRRVQQRRGPVGTTQNQVGVQLVESLPRVRPVPWSASSLPEKAKLCRTRALISRARGAARGGAPPARQRRRHAAPRRRQCPPRRPQACVARAPAPRAAGPDTELKVNWTGARRGRSARSEPAGRRRSSTRHCLCHCTSYQSESSSFARSHTPAGAAGRRFVASRSIRRGICGCAIKKLNCSESALPRPSGPTGPTTKKRAPFQRASAHFSHALPLCSHGLRHV